MSNESMNFLEALRCNRNGGGKIKKRGMGSKLIWVEGFDEIIVEDLLSRTQRFATRDELIDWLGEAIQGKKYWSVSKRDGFGLTGTQALEAYKAGKTIEDSAGFFMVESGRHELLNLLCNPDVKWKTVDE
jgi:hypothetical protein